MAGGSVSNSRTYKQLDSSSFMTIVHSRLYMGHAYEINRAFLMGFFIDSRERRQ